MESSPLFAQALDAHRAGRTADALRLLKTVLEGDPTSLEALVLQGVTLAQSRDLNGATQSLKRALAVDADCVEALIALSTVTKVSDPAKAIELAKEATTLQPHDADLHQHLGLLFVEFRQFQQAAESFQAATELAPWDLNAMRNLAMAQRDAGREFDSIATWERLVEADPTSVPARLNLGQMLLAHGRFPEAISVVAKVIERDPRNPVAHLMTALALAEDGRGSEAEPYLKKAIQLNPKDGIANASLGFWYQEQGRFDEARALLEKAIALNPNHGFAYYNLFRAKKATEGDRPLLSQMEKLAAEPRLHARDSGYLNYALGKAHEDLGEFEAAMARYDAGNQAAYQVWLARKPWDKAAYAEAFARTRETYTAESLVAPEGNPSELPIMIVGMIRSGTSLLEQILSSHPEIAGAGELPFWHKNEQAASDPSQLARLADEYLASLRAFAPQATRVTDKLPHNYAMLGQIRSALPSARMIHVRRNPAAHSLNVYTAQ